MLPLLRCIFAHLLILQYPDHHQNLISSSLYYSGPVHKISSQSVHNFLSNVVHRQTNKQTNQRYQKHNLLCQGGNQINADELFQEIRYISRKCVNKNTYTSLKNRLMQKILTPTKRRQESSVWIATLLLNRDPSKEKNVRLQSRK